MSDAAALSPAPPLEARALEKRFRGGDGSELHILRGVTLRLESGEAVAVVGASGAGKSTLLHLLGALDRPSAGEVFLGGRPVAGLDDEAVAAVRNRHVGFVFQFHHLLREFTALENVMMPALLAGTGFDEARERAHALLLAVGVEGREGHKPRQLSGGEQQRVAVARALVNEPLVLLADEPSGNLDEDTSARLHELIRELARDFDQAFVIMTHDRALAESADRKGRLEMGRLHFAANGGAEEAP